MTEQDFPIKAIVGLERAKHAMMLLAVDPGLKGLLILSPSGTGKTLLVRSFRSIIPMADRGSDLSFNLEASPIVQVPTGVTEDNLIGGVDLARTVAEGRRRVSKGLLAQADGGFLCVEHLDLIDNANMRHLLAALDTGVVRIERDGISASHEARFALIGTLDAWNPETAPALKDRMGLIVEQHGAPLNSERAEIVYRSESYFRGGDRLYADFAVQTRELRREILGARSRLGSVRMERVQRSWLISRALDLGIESSRADLLAVRAARVSAALRGAAEVGEDDITAAVEYVLLPRVRGYAEAQPVASELAAAADAARPMDRPEAQRESLAAGDNSKGQSDRMDDAVLASQDCPVPRELGNSVRARGLSLSKVRTKSGRRTEQTWSTHGRYFSAVPAADGSNHKRIAIDATLRAAAPYQRIRRALGNPRPEDPGETSRASQPGTANRAFKNGEHEQRVIIKPVDLRVKKLKHRSGALFIFLVDTSGSMALGRIGHAKGVMIRMLRQAYLNRDRVALIAFRGTAVEVLLEPTSSIELVRRAIESMPAGGGTPLAAGLGGSIALAERANKKMPGRTMLLVFTDGRVNVPLRRLGSSGKNERDPVIRAELQLIGQQLGRSGIKTVVIDTGSWEVKGGRCAAIAEMIGAKYCRLPRSGPDGLYKQLRELTES